MADGLVPSESAQTLVRMRRDGFAVLRQTIPVEIVETIRSRALGLIASADVPATWVNQPDYAAGWAREGRVTPQMFGAGFYAPVQFLRDTLTDLLGGWSHQDRDTINIVHSRKAPSSTMGIGWHTDGMYYEDRIMAITMWIPLDICGGDAPGLALARGGAERVRDVLGYRADAASVAVAEGLPANIYRYASDWKDRLNERFVEAHFEIERPVVAPGDIVLLTSWCLHATHRLLDMSSGRAAMQVRVIGTNRDLVPPDCLTTTPADTQTNQFPRRLHFTETCVNGAIQAPPL